MVAAETGSTPRFQIVVEEYERPFDNPEELLENVEEREWIELDEIQLFVTARASDEGQDALEVSILMATATGARLTLRGADRRARNAIEPDLVDAIERSLTSTDEGEAARYIWPGFGAGLALAAPCIVFVIRETKASERLNSSGSAFLFSLGWLLLAGIFVMCAFSWPSAVRGSIRTANPPAEFLNDAERTAWDAWKDQVHARIKFVAQVVGVLAAIAAIASAIGLLVS